MNAPMIHRDLVQGTDEWLAARRGRYLPGTARAIRKGTQMNTRLPPGSAVILSALLGACVYVAVVWWALG